MKKTYIAPELFAVELQHQDNVLVKTSFVDEGPGTGLDAQVKEFDFVDDEEDDAGAIGPRNIWSEEW